MNPTIRKTLFLTCLFAINILLAGLTYHHGPKLAPEIPELLTPNERKKLDSLRDKLGNEGLLIGSKEELEFNHLMDKKTKLIIEYSLLSAKKRKAKIKEFKRSFLYQAYSLISLSWILLLFYFLNVKGKNGLFVWLLFSGFTSISFVSYLYVNFKVAI